MVTGMQGQLVRRWWVVALLLILLITGAALAWNASPASPHTYTATRTLWITSLPADGAGAGAYGASVAQAHAAALAHVLAAPSMLTSPMYTEAVIGRLGGSKAFGANGALPSGSAVGQALRASHTGGNVTISASWDSPDGASVLADAAVQTLAMAGAQSTLPDGSSLSTTVEGLGDPAQLAVEAQAARSKDILVRGGLAGAAVLIVAGALAATEMARRQGESPTTTAESARS